MEEYKRLPVQVSVTAGYDQKAQPTLQQNTFRV
jgi:hypothetical protein